MTILYAGARLRLSENVLTALISKPAGYACGLQAVGNERRISSSGINHMAAHILPASTQRSTIDYG
jgi:hypothetical protein